MINFQRLIHNSAQKAIANNIVIYGAGKMGYEVLEYANKHGLNVFYFIDVRHEEIKNINGIPVLSIQDFIEKYYAIELDIVISLFDCGYPFADLVKKLKEAGFRNVFSLIDLVNIFPDFKDSANFFWLSDKTFYQDKDDLKEELFSIFTEEKSRYLLESVLKFRITGDYSCMAEPSLDDQYFPVDLPPLPQPLRMINCGAYTGDTIMNILEKGYLFEEIATFEPDLENYRQMVNNLSGLTLNTINFPAGVYSSTKLARFEGNAGDRCRINEHGIEMIQLIKIDDALPLFKPNYINMDIEGAELEAIKGALKVIRSSVPNLAISIYHNPIDLFTIPLFIKNLNLNYAFFVRCHSYASFDIVLYCINKKYIS